MIFVLHYCLALSFFSNTAYTTPNNYKHPNVGLSVILNDGEALCFFCKTTPSLQNNLIKRKSKKNSKLIVTFPIRKNILWNDGKKLVASDFLIGWEKIRNDIVIRNQLPYRFINNVSADDIENQLIVSFKERVFNHLHLPLLIPVYSQPTSNAITGLNDSMDDYFHAQPSRFVEWIGFNLRNPLLQDIRVREAISLLMPWKEIRQLASQYRNMSVSNKPFVDNQNLDNPAFHSDPEKARKLFEESGWIKQNRLYTKNSTPLSIQIDYRNEPTWRASLVNLIKEKLAESNIRVTLKRHRSKAVFLEKLQKMDYPDMVLYGIESKYSVPPNTWLSEDAIPSKGNRYTGQNFTGWRNNNIAKLLNRYSFTVSREKHLDIAKKLNKEIMENKPGLVLFHYNGGTQLGL